MASATQTAANIASNTKRWHGEDSDEYRDAKRKHAAVAIEEFITRTVAAAPPLTDDQRLHLAGLLQGTSDRIGALETRVDRLAEEVAR